MRSAVSPGRTSVLVVNNLIDIDHDSHGPSPPHTVYEWGILIDEIAPAGMLVANNIGGNSRDLQPDLGHNEAIWLFPEKKHHVFSLGTLDHPEKATPSAKNPKTEAFCRVAASSALCILASEPMIADFPSSRF